MTATFTFTFTATYLSFVFFKRNYLMDVIKLYEGKGSRLRTEWE